MGPFSGSNPPPLPSSNPMKESTYPTHSSSSSSSSSSTNQDHLGEKVLSPLTTLSSHVDPWPHYIMASACGVGSYWAYLRLMNPKLAGLIGLCGVGYLYAGQQINLGHDRMGHDVATLTSLGLVGITGKKAWEMADPFHTVLTSLGGISSLGNLVKSYQLRTGHPHDLHSKKSV